MSSTEHCIGMAEQRSSSRVLKPPGGGHSNIFSPADEIKPHARPKYDQQNSSNLNFCMNTVDPNEKVAQKAPSYDVSDQHEAPASAKSNEAPQPAKSELIDAAKPAENLPTYHHHRSTALW